MFNKFKGLLDHDIIFQSLLVVLVGVVSFGLGRLSLADVPLQASSGVEAVMVESVPVTTAGPTAEEASRESAHAPIQYVGSRNGTKFHLLSCPGASSIKEENKVYFSSKQEAYSKGYTEAANCKGI